MGNHSILYTFAVLKATLRYREHIDSRPRFVLFFFFPEDNKDALTTSEDMIPLSKRPGYTGNQHLPTQKNTSSGYLLLTVETLSWIKAKSILRKGKLILILCLRTVLLKLIATTFCVACQMNTHSL